MAQAQARMFSDKMLTYRQWNTVHGGVYVEVGHATRPNPFLQEFPERDIRTPSGRTLTLVNPAAMIRDINAVEQDLFGASGRITSLHPLNPDNAPDMWEQQALMELRDGRAEVVSVSEEGELGYLRMMRPLYLKEKCLECHARHGHHAGDLRGGISTRISLAPLMRLGQADRLGMVSGAILLWLTGLMGVWGGCCQLRRLQEKRLRAEERLEYLDHYDALTGLANQEHFSAKLDLIIHSHSGFDASPVAVVLIEVETFRQLNRAYGQAQGNRLLCDMGRRIRSVLGEYGTAAHFGGGLFALTLPFVRQAAEADQLVMRMLTALSREYLCEGRTYHPAARAGITLFPADGLSGIILMQNAHIALNAAQLDERSAAVGFFSESLRIEARQQACLQHDLHRAMERNEFFLQYQPQVNIAEGCVIGLEALLRWQHPEQGELAPDQFIPLAEASGLVNDLNYWTFRHVCRQIRSWLRDGHQDLPPVAVNLSAGQFHESGLTSRIEGILAEEGLSSSAVVLEITESALMADLPQAMATMDALQKSGVRLAVDDFGTGYSSLSYLKDFPLDCIKIDRSFLRDLPGDGTSAAIVAAIVELGRNIGLHILAEGVERADQVDCLMAVGCQFFQGFYFGRPLSPDQVPEFLGRPLAVTEKRQANLKPAVGDLISR